MAVVTEVRNTACALTERLSTMAARFSSPRPCATKAVIKICTQSATATVRIMVGAPEAGGDKGMPSQPPEPMAARADKVTTTMAAKVANNLRVVRISTTAISKNMVGVSVAKSLCAASENELDSICEPVNSIRISGYLARMASCKARASVTIELVAATSSLGGRKDTMTAAVRLSCDMRRPAKSGSFNTVSSI